MRMRCFPVAALIAGLLLPIMTAGARADWTQTSGPRGGLIRALEAVPDGSGGSRLFAGQIRVWRTDDSGENWIHLTNGLTDPNAFTLLSVPSGSGNDLFVGTNGGVFRSDDGGESWSATSNGLTNLSVYALGAGPDGSGGTNLYAGAFLGNAYRSSDHGASWVPIESGFPVGYNVNAFTTTAPGTVLAGTMNGIYRSTNFGASWTRVFTLFAFAFAQNGTTLYAGTSNGVYRSTNDGGTWTPINNGLGFTWVRAMAAIPNGSGVTLFAGAGGVLRSTDNGTTWTSVNNGMPILAVHALRTVPNESGGTDLYAGTAEGIYRTTDNGNSWSAVSFIYSSVRSLEVTPNGTVLAGTENDIFRSSDLGDTWTDTEAGVAALDFTVNFHGTSGVSLFAGDSPSGIHKSTNDGASWFGSSNGLDDFDVNSMGAVPNGSGGTNLLAGTYSGLFISTGDGSHWAQVPLNTLPLDYVVTPNGPGGYNVFTGGFGGVWRSIDHGFTWTEANAGLESFGVQALAATSGDATVFAAGSPFGVYRSMDNGATWTPVNTGLTDLRVGDLLSPDGTHLLAAGAGGVYLSADEGDSWTAVSEGLTTGVGTLALSADGATLLAGTAGYGVWRRPLSEILGVSDVPDGTAGAGPGLLLHVNYPNPAAPETTIRYTLPGRMPVRLSIHDVSGRLVRRLIDSVQEPGSREVVWDGRDVRGSLVAAGVYVYRLEAEGVTLSRKMNLLR